MPARPIELRPYRVGVYVAFGVVCGVLFFNLIPLAPLDGEKVLAYFLPPNLQAWMDRIRPYGPMILFALVFLGSIGSFNVIGTLVHEPAIRLLRLLLQ